MPKKLRGHVTLATPPFRKIFQGSRRDFPGSIRVKFEVSTFNRFEAISNFTGSRDPGHAPFYPLLTLGGWRPPRDIV